MAEYTTHAYAGGRSEAIRTGLRTPDFYAIDTLSDGMTGWIKKNIGEQISERIKDLTVEALKEGWTARTFGDKLAGAMKDVDAGNGPYWQILADHQLNKAHNVGAVAGYEAAQVRRVKVVAVLDKKTSPICRAMHGRIIDMGILSAQRDRILAAAGSGDIEAVKAAQPMVKGSTSPVTTQMSTKEATDRSPCCLRSRSSPGRRTPARSCC